MKSSKLSPSTMRFITFRSAFQSLKSPTTDTPARVRSPYTEHVPFLSGLHLFVRAEQFIDTLILS